MGNSQRDGALFIGGSHVLISDASGESYVNTEDEKSVTLISSLFDSVLPDHKFIPSSKDLRRTAAVPFPTFEIGIDGSD
jgi:hypothetical protein